MKFKINKKEYIVISNKAQTRTMQEFDIKPLALIHRTKSSKKAHIWNIGSDDTWCKAAINGAIYLFDWKIITNKFEFLSVSEKLKRNNISFCSNCKNNIYSEEMNYFYRDLLNLEADDK